MYCSHSVKCLACDSTTDRVARELPSPLFLCLLSHNKWQRVCSARGLALKMDVMANCLEIIVQVAPILHPAEPLVPYRSWWREAEADVIGDRGNDIKISAGCKTSISHHPPVRPAIHGGATYNTELVSEAASLVAEFPSFFLTGFTQPWAHIVGYICRSTVATALHCPCYFGSREWGVPYFGTNCFGCPSSVY